MKAPTTAPLITFLSACGLNADKLTFTAAHLTGGGRTVMLAEIGEQSQQFKKAIKAAGWQRIEKLRLKVGSESTYTHDDLEGCISLHEFPDAHFNHVRISN